MTQTVGPSPQSEWPEGEAKEDGTGKLRGCLRYIQDDDIQAFYVALQKDRGL